MKPQELTSNGEFLFLKITHLFRVSFICLLSQEKCNNDDVYLFSVFDKLKRVFSLNDHLITDRQVRGQL